MIFLEMSRDEIHGGGNWGFPKCVWAPLKTRRGSSWPYWSKILQISEGDIIIHLRGISPNANFVGYSIASSAGFITSNCPPEPKEWSYAKEFYRANLSNFVQFHKPINLLDIFSSRKRYLEEYLENYKSDTSENLNVFYVKQAGRLQCLNGAYLSNVDNTLFYSLFGDGDPSNQIIEGNPVISIQTGVQVSTIQSRIGQKKFSDEIKKIYGNKCCFPGCDINDPRFLIGSHIARWSDNENLRGNLGNGLCLCLMHDKAFELGIFTIDKQFCISINPKVKGDDSLIVQEITKQQGKQISLTRIKPLIQALQEHWDRIDMHF